ncbi:MAG: hypothetical protein IAF38_21165 [Bacteroidia bacterium]|nr:hypothetical protein [Bacteroidia bacterium]
METLNNNSKAGTMNLFFSFINKLFSKENSVGNFLETTDETNREQRLMRHENRVAQNSVWSSSPWL